MTILCWVKGVVTGDLGQSIRFSKPVSELIVDRLPVTISLAVITLTIVVLVAIPLGIFVARRQNKFSDVVLSSVTQFRDGDPFLLVRDVIDPLSRHEY